MSSCKSNLEKERKTVKTMIKMYCKNHHSSKIQFCNACLELLEYASNRLKHCRYGENKPTCENCPVHCYKPEMREKIRSVMRYSGPRMIYTHPIMGFRHIFKKLRKFDNHN